MIRTAHIRKDFGETGSLSRLVNLEGAADDRVLFTKSGHVLAVLEVAGADPECLDDSQLRSVCQTFESAFRNLDEQFRVYQHIVKRRYGPIVPDATPMDSVAGAATSSRSAYLAQKSDLLFRVNVFVTVVFEGESRQPDLKERLAAFLAEPSRSVRELLSEGALANAQNDRIAHAAETLSAKVENLVVQLSDAARVEWLGKHAAGRFFRGLLNYSAAAVDGFRLKHDAHLDYQICGSSLECYRGHLLLGNHHVEVLSLKEPPAQTFAGMLKELLRIPSEFVIASEWKRENNAAMRRLIQAKRRHHHNSKTSIATYLNSSPAGPRDPLVDEGASSVVTELGRCLEDLDVGGIHYGRYTLTVICHGEDAKEVKKSVAQFHRIFAACDGQLIDERFNLLNAFLAVIPGNSARNLRALWLSSRNAADLSFAFSPDVGQARNDHLQRESLSVLETRDGTPYFFNLHVGDVGHTLVLGATGSGKSFLLNFLVTSAQKYDPLTFIFDLGGSYEHLTRLFGGTFVRVGLGDDSVRINPFCLEQTEQNLRFLFAFVRVLIEHGGTTLSAAEEKDLYAQIENLYVVAPEERRLRTLANVLSRRLRTDLEKWLEGGPYGGLFDNATDNVTLAEFQTFDFEGLSKSPQIEPLLFYILHRASAAILEPDALARPKFFVMDEAWRFFRHPTIKAYIVEALKTWRKKNASMILATQSSDDLLQSEMMSVISESCPTKLFLANPGMDRATYQNLFRLNDTEASLIASLAPKEEILIKRPAGAKIVKLGVGRREYWIYTSNPFDHQKRRDAIERHGFRRGLEILSGENA